MNLEYGHAIIGTRLTFASKKWHHEPSSAVEGAVKGQPDLLDVDI